MGAVRYTGREGSGRLRAGKEFVLLIAVQAVACENLTHRVWGTNKDAESSDSVYLAENDKPVAQMKSLFVSVALDEFRKLSFTCHIRCPIYDRCTFLHSHKPEDKIQESFFMPELLLS